MNSTVYREASASSAVKTRQGNPGTFLHALFEGQADIRPDQLAIDGPDMTLSYAELDARANMLAHFLRAQSVGPGDFVGLNLSRSSLPIIAILACLKAGAAYVPLDPSHPDERIRFIIDEAEIRLIITEQDLQRRLETLSGGKTISIDTFDFDPAIHDTTRLPASQTGLKPSDACYVLYTSGTTGRPKGVVAEHRNVVHFVKAFNKVCRTSADDRIYQGFALTFDGSVEEIWMAFSNGATLITGDGATPKFGNELAQVLRDTRANFFSTVPTLLSTMSEDIPDLRQLVVSGEACPPELVARWARPGRTMLNVYGPTEATVNTTAAILEPGKPVTIGKPLDGYDALILNERLQPVLRGEKGELFIGGPSISRGYLNQPELTGKSYVHLVVQNARRFYRTGDLVRWNDDDELEFFGRIDSQVKVRGFRVELSEIEEVLLTQPGITSAAVNVVERQGSQSLAAYILTEAGAPVDRKGALAAMRSKLPSYMVPGFLEQLDAFPMLASGKVDRKQLPEPQNPLLADAGMDDATQTVTEKKIAKTWAALFQLPSVGATQDFFLDLGGHSLMAAQLVTKLREEAEIKIPVRAIYSHPTIRQLAAHVDALQTDAGKSQSAGEHHHTATLKAVRREPGAGMIWVQLLYLVVLGPLFAVPLIITMPAVMDMLYFRATIIDTIIFLILVGLALWPLAIAIGLAGKWLIIGRYKPGVYPLWSSYYTRWWLASRLQGLSGLGLFGGTPLAPFLWRLMGAKVGKHCILQSGLVSAWDCISIGDDTSIGPDTQLPGARVENGFLIIGRIDIGNGCYVGSHSSLGLDVAMGDGARLDDQSALPDGAHMPPGAHWRGSPAAAGDVPAPEGEAIRYLPGYLSWFCFLQVLTGIAAGLVFGLPFIAAAIAMGFLVVHAQFWIVFLVVFFGAPLSLLIFCVYVAFVKKVILPNPEAGVFPVYSRIYLQYWLTAGILRAVRGVGLLIFTTLYLPPWMRLLGAKLGRHTEMSTVWSFFPDFIEAGDGVFFADGSILGGSRVHLGRFAIAPVIIGNRSFIGNSAMAPPGSGLGDNSLLGVLSLPPVSDQRTPDKTDWLGSPAFELPNRQIVEGFDQATTYEPTRSLYLQRAMIDSLRILIPLYLGATLGTLGFYIAIYLYNNFGVWAVFAAAPVLGWLFMAIAIAVTVTIKKLVMGTFKPVIVPLWSRYVWLNEMINGIYEVVMSPIVGLFYGTPFASPLLRLIGCDIGKHCYIGSSLFSEFDLVHIGDYAAINGGAIIQNHLFEDRIMKSSHLYIGDGCSVGNMSVVLYDTRMGEDAVLCPLSLLMKGEIMPPGNRWHGVPTVQD